MRYDELLKGFFHEGAFFQNNIPQKIEQMTNIELFLTYLDTFKIDPNQLPDPSEKDGLSEWSNTIRSKFAVIYYSYEETKDFLDKWKGTNEEFKIKAYGSTKPSDLLTLKYETFMNCIYSFCESLAVTLQKMYPKRNLPPQFNSLKKGIMRKKFSINVEFDRLIQESDWYDEVHWVRTEAIHYLFGFVYIFGDSEPGYLNTIFNKRANGPTEIDFKIGEHIEKIFTKLSEFLFRLGDILILELDPDIPMIEICFHNPTTFQIGTRLKTINDRKNNRSGICTKLYDQCPMRFNCGSYF